MEIQFAEFIPIRNMPKENILAYYSENNLPYPNEYFLNYFSTPETQTPKVNQEINWGNIPIPQLSFQQTPIKTTNPTISAPILNTEPIDIKEGEIKEEEVKEPEVVTKPLTSDIKFYNDFHKEIYSLEIPEEDKQYLDILAKGESYYDPYITNQFGYYGAYQFGKAAFKELNLTKKDFESNPKVQHFATLKLAKNNEQYLKNYYKKYLNKDLDIEKDLVGKEINGIKITRNGLRAMMHHQGALTVFDLLNGTEYSPLTKKNFKDANNVSIFKYLRKFEKNS